MSERQPSDPFQLPQIATPVRLSTFVDCDPFGKMVIDETYREPKGNCSKWRLFGAKIAPVVVLPLTTENMVIALAHYRYGAEQVIWELPGGGIEQGSTPEKTVQIELGEESGYAVAVSDMVRLHVGHESSGGIWFDPASVRVQFLPFLAKSCRKDESKRKLGEGEHVQVKEFTITQWYEGIASGKIMDSKSLAVSILAISQFDDCQRKAALAGLCPSE